MNQGQTSAYRWVIFGTWVLFWVAGVAMVVVLGILLPSISSELSLSPSEQGILGSAGFWGSLLLAVPLSLLLSRYRPKILTTVTMIVAFLCLLLQGWAPAFFVLVLGRIGLGVAVLAREPARALLIRQWFRPREVIFVNSIGDSFFGVIVGTGLIVTPFLLGALGDNWRIVLYAFAVATAVMAVLWVIIGREGPAASPDRRTPTELGILRSALRDRDLWIAGMGFVGITIPWGAFVAFFPTHALETTGISLEMAGVILAVGIIVGGPSSLGVGYLLKNVDVRRPLIIVQGLVMTGTYLGIALTGNLPLLLALSLINGLTWGCWPVLHTVAFQLPGVKPREVAVGLGFLLSAISLGTVLGPLLAGFIQEATGDLRLTLTILSFGGLSLTAAGILLRFSRLRMEGPDEGSQQAVEAVEGDG